jgi:type I site-specific restriction endonuclease
MRYGNTCVTFVKYNYRAETNKEIVERFYQVRAIRRIGEAFEKDNERKALVVMATGAGRLER